MQKLSNAIGGIIQLGGIVITIVGLSITDVNEKLGWSIAGLIITFAGRFIREYELLD